MAITITIPAAVTTNGEKMLWLWNFEEKLRVVHNRVGIWHRDGGVTLNQYNNLLPALVKNRFAYVPQLSEADWLRFVALHQRYTQALHFLMSDLIEAAKADNSIDVNLDRDSSGD